MVRTREALLQELHDLSQRIQGPFPYDDLRKMRKIRKLTSHFKMLGGDDQLSADLNTYFMTIHGLASRLLTGNAEGAPATATHWLAHGDFFSIFPKYCFLKDEWEHFPQFAQMYENTKRMQEIVLALLLTEDEL